MSQLFKTVIGSSGYDVALDVIELEGSYIIVGASGSICDIVDAFAVKIDKNDGSVISSNIFGDLNQGVEENFQSVVHDGNGNLYATGFTVKRSPPSSNPADSCSWPGWDSNILVAQIDTNLNKIKVDTVKGPNDNGFVPWDQGISTFLIQDKFYVTGQYADKLGIIGLDQKFRT